MTDKRERAMTETRAQQETTTATEEAARLLESLAIEARILDAGPWRAVALLRHFVLSPRTVGELRAHAAALRRVEAQYGEVARRIERIAAAAEAVLDPRVVERAR